MRTRGCTPLYKLKLKRCTQHRFDLNNLFMSAYINSGSKGVAVVRAVVRALASHECGPGFKSRRRRHMWVGFVFGSLLCTESFFSGFPVFFPPPTISFSLGRKWLIHKRSQKKIEIFWFFWLQFCSLRAKCSKGNRKGILGRGGRKGKACYIGRHYCRRHPAYLLCMQK